MPYKEKIFIPIFAGLLLSASPASPLVSSGMKQTAKNERQTISKAVMTQEIKAASAHKTTSGKGSESTGDIVIVDPKQMASDWKSAFSMLKVKQTSGIIFHLANGEMIQDIMEIEPLEGGYLMFFTVKDLHGLQYKVIKTSEIISLSTK